jgi:hypothetical protein
MQIKRQLAADSTALEDPIDALVEVLTEMLEENLGPARSTGHQVAETAIADLRSSEHGVTHVLKVLELQLWQ